MNKCEKQIYELQSSSRIFSKSPWRSTAAEMHIIIIISHHPKNFGTRLFDIGSSLHCSVQSSLKRSAL